MVLKVDVVWLPIVLPQLVPCSHMPASFGDGSSASLCGVDERDEVSGAAMQVLPGTANAGDYVPFCLVAWITVGSGPCAQLIRSSSGTK